MSINRFALLVVFLFYVTVHATAQQPSPTPPPERTGRSYSTPDLPKTPPPPGFPKKSDLTFEVRVEKIARGGAALLQQQMLQQQMQQQQAPPQQ